MSFSFLQCLAHNRHWGQTCWLINFIKGPLPMWECLASLKSSFPLCAQLRVSIFQSFFIAVHSSCYFFLFKPAGYNNMCLVFPGTGPSAVILFISCRVSQIWFEMMVDTLLFIMWQHHQLSQNWGISITIYKRWALQICLENFEIDAWSFSHYLQW